MQKASNQRGIAAPLIILLVLALMLVGGIAVTQALQAKKTPATSTPSTKPVAKPAPTVTSTPTPTAPAAPTTPAESDTQLVLDAVKADCVSHGGVDIASPDGFEIVGNGAKVGVKCLASANDQNVSGYEVLLAKLSGTWTVVYEGQDPPVKALGQKYGFPADWVQTSY